MTDKQRKMLYRIIATVVLYIASIIVVNMDSVFAIDFPFFELCVFLIPYIVIGWDIAYKAVRNIFNGQVFDENFLMFIASIGAFVVGEYMEAVAVILFYQVGELFQDYAVNRSRKSIADLMNICPEFANVEIDGKVTQVDPDEVEVGTVIVVKPGERIPLDGIVVDGESMIDTSSLTGESVPRRIKAGDEIISGCINGSGVLRVKTTKEFDDSTVAKILELVENASSNKANVENFITRFARYYTPFVVCVAVVLAVIPPIFLGNWFDWLKRACIFLVISCPCALVISVPLSFFGGIGAASRNGILVKGSNFLEAMANVNTIVFDKTGTLTKGDFTIQSIEPVKNLISEEELLKIAAYAESFSEHPVAGAIKNAFLKTSASIEEGLVEDYQELSGHGIKAKIQGCDVLVGNEKLLNAQGIAFEKSDNTGTKVYVAKDNNYVGLIIIADTVKENSASAIKALKKLGVKKTVMLTGDTESVGKSVGEKLGLDKVYAQLLPKDKVKMVESILSDIEKDKKSSLCYVGDGINDAPVLARADVGIAMGSMGSDAAIEAADIVLMDDDITKIAKVVNISRKTLRIVKQNIVFALGVKGIIMLLGAFGIANMWEAVFADVGVSIIAIINAMRLLRTK